jgi:hypothetical protein
MVCVSVPDPLLRSSLLVVEFHEAIRTAIPGIVESSKHSETDVRSAAIRALSELGVHGLRQHP